MQNQLLINVPTVLGKLVLTITNNRQDDVILKLLDNVKFKEKIENNRILISFVEEWHRNHKRHAYMHSNGCGCEYCIKTKEYANLKLSIHKIRSRLDDDFYLYPSERYKQPWMAYIYINRSRKHIGYYSMPLEAARARDEFIMSNQLQHKLNFGGYINE